MARNELDTTLVTHFRGAMVSSGNRRTPMGFGRMKMTHEQAELVSRLAMSTFVEMVNNGHTFDAAISAVYMTGFENAAMASRKN